MKLPGDTTDPTHDGEVFPMCLVCLCRQEKKQTQQIPVIYRRNVKLRLVVGSWDILLKSFGPREKKEQDRKRK